MNQDRLLEILLQTIESAQIEHDPDELITEVVAQYMFELMKTGDVPQHSLDTLETYLQEEALDIYRKKTYGYLSFKEYKNSKSQKQQT